MLVHENFIVFVLGHVALGFPLSGLFHRCSILIFIYI